MPDITMCVNIDCSMRLECYRYTAKPSEYSQAFMLFKQDETGDCGHFISASVEVGI